MTKIALAVATGLIALTSTTAFAYDRTGYDRTGERREAYQERAIEQARRSGELNGREYRQLQSEQARIDELQRRAKADGRVDRYESAQIRRAQNEASRHISQESHDSEKAGGGRRWNRWW